uniref:Uncharacterized protein n=1 Tax=Arundo donax TaxID=35708 RepID=A0A0A9BYL4_ARUDO
MVCRESDLLHFMVFFFYITMGCMRFSLRYATYLFVLGYIVPDILT